jgi:hypothetical protein
LNGENVSDSRVSIKVSASLKSSNCILVFLLEDVKKSGRAVHSISDPVVAVVFGSIKELVDLGMSL